MAFVFDTEIPRATMLSNKKRPFHLDDQVIAFHQDAVPLASITGAEVMTWPNVQNGITNGTNYQLKLFQGEQVTKMHWLVVMGNRAETKASAAQAYDLACQLLRHHCAQRIAATYPMSTTTFQGYTFAPQSVTHKGLLHTTTIAWPQVTGVALDNPMEYTVGYLDEFGMPQTLGSANVGRRDGLFFPEIFDAYARATGNLA